jgi:hypothetical protein
MLCLGETVVFQSLYEKNNQKLEIRNQKLLLIEASLLSSQTVSCIHDFVAHRFTTYKNAIPLWISEDIDTLLKRKPTSKLKGESKKSKVNNIQKVAPFDTTNNNIYT